MAESKRPETPETDIAPTMRPIKSTDTRPFDEGRIRYEDEVKHHEDRVPGPAIPEGRKLEDPRDQFPIDE